LPNQIVRIASGILISLYPSNKENVGIIIAAIITLNVGVIPLMMCNIGFLRLILARDFPSDDKLRKRIIYSRIGFFLGIFLLTAGGVLVGQYNNPNFVQIGIDLAKAGYFAIAAVLALIIVFEIYFLRLRAQLSHASYVVLIAIMAAMPFQIVRLTYALLGEFHYGEDQWSPLYGPAGPFVGMVLLMELAAAVIFLAAGYTIPPIPKQSKAEVVEAGEA
jgi:hypothetical protein